MQEYFEQFPQENGSIFLFNAYTGEAIYDVDRWGSPLPDAHKLSHWFEPTAMVPPLNFEDSPPSRVDIGDVSSTRAEAVVSSQWLTAPPYCTTSARGDPLSAILPLAPTLAS